MKPAEVKEIYVEACRAKRRVPENGEAELWVKALALLDTGDLRAALDAWWRDSTPDKNGEPRGKWMPTPSDLIPMAHKARRESEAVKATVMVLARWCCDACGVYTAGFIDPFDYKRRYCQAIPQRPHKFGEICGGDMTQVYREAA